MKTFKEFQKIGDRFINSGNAEDIKTFQNAKKTIIIRAEYKGEVYEMEADGTKAIVALALNKTDLALGTQCGDARDICSILFRLMLGIPEEFRYAVMAKLAEHDMLLNDMKQGE